MMRESMVITLTCPECRIQHSAAGPNARELADRINAAHVCHQRQVCRCVQCDRERRLKRK